MTKLIDPSKMAQMLDINRRALLAKAGRGEIPSVRLGHRTVRFDPAEVLESLQRNDQASLRKGG